MMIGSLDPLEKKGEDKLSKATKDSCKTTIEAIHGLMTQIVKNRLFNQVSCNPTATNGNNIAGIHDMEQQ